MRQSWWQMLPIGPTGYGNSPYQSPSTFAGNPLLIGFESVLTDGLLTSSEFDAIGVSGHTKVVYDSVIPIRMNVLDRITSEFGVRASRELRVSLHRFVSDHGTVWLDDFAMFTALKRAHGSRPWWQWPSQVRDREPGAIDEVTRELRADMNAVRIEQFLFDRQFRAVRADAADRGIGLIGDIPIFVAHDSADVWAHRNLYHLDTEGMPTVIAGVPPDYFSATGQRWGNPLYEWDEHAETDFAWWKHRLSRIFEHFDLVRVDHFRGFSASWHIPASEATAENGTWVKSPGVALFDALADHFADLDIIAEDLGLITPDVVALRDRYGFPGMKVLQFGFGTESGHALSEFTPNMVAYTGTHDNDTARGWFESRMSENPAELAEAIHQLSTSAETFAWDLIGAVLDSVADTAIVPVQDLLGLGAEARMNLPGTIAHNWTWRLDPTLLDADIVERMAQLTITSRRSR